MNETYALLVGLGILIVLFVIGGIIRSNRQQQEPAQLSETGSFNATVEDELYPASVNITLVFWATIAYNVNKLCLWI